MHFFVKVAEIQPSSVRVGLKINMRTPTIIMPKMSKSPDLLLFRFDSLQISNSIKTEYLADESTQEWNDISFKVKAMQISRYILIYLLSWLIFILHNIFISEFQKWKMLLFRAFLIYWLQLKDSFQFNWMGINFFSMIFEFDLFFTAYAKTKTEFKITFPTTHWIYLNEV